MAVGTWEGGKVLRENFVGFSRLQTNPLTVRLNRALTKGAGESVGSGLWLGMRYRGAEDIKAVFLVV